MINITVNYLGKKIPIRMFLQILQILKRLVTQIIIFSIIYKYNGNIASNIFFYDNFLY